MRPWEITEFTLDELDSMREHVAAINEARLSQSAEAGLPASWDGVT